jgi:hypothetical protein
VRLPVAVVTVALVLASFASPASAAAPGERVAIAVFSVTGQSLVDEAKDKLRNSLRGGLAAAGFDVVPQPEVDKAVSAAGLAGCDTMSCLRRIGELVMARRVVKANVEVIGNTHFVSSLELIELSDGRTVASSKDNCDVCTMKEVNDGLSNAAAALRMQLEGPAAPPTPPTVIATSPPPPPSKRPLWLGLTGVAAAVVAGGAVSLGVAAAYHGQNHCDGSLPASDKCNSKYNGTPGIAVGAVGVAAGLAAGGYFLYRALKAPPRYVSVVPSLGAGAATLEAFGIW